MQSLLKKLFICLGCGLLLTSPAFAAMRYRSRLTEETLREYAQIHNLFYDPSCVEPDSLIGNAAGLMEETGSHSNLIWNYLAQKTNFSPEIIAGIIGNFQQESYEGINPFEQTGSHYGIYQAQDDLKRYMESLEPFKNLGNIWQHGHRYPSSIQESQNAENLAVQAIVAQLDFMLQGGYGNGESVATGWKNFNNALAKETPLAGSEGVAHYAELFRKEFERNNESEEDKAKRVAYAQAIYNDYVNGAIADIAINDPNFFQANEVCEYGDSLFDSITGNAIADLAMALACVGAESGINQKWCNIDGIRQALQAARIDADYTYLLDCGKFVATVVRAVTQDFNFPKSGTGNIKPYLENSPNWVEVSPNDVRPGDVGIARGSNGGHTMIYGPEGKMIEAWVGQRTPNITDARFTSGHGTVHIYRYVGN